MIPVLLFVEGQADEEFIVNIIQPNYSQYYFEIIKYARKKPSKIQAYLRAEQSKQAQGISSFILLSDADFDHNDFDNSVNIEDRIGEVTTEFRTQEKDIVIVVNEIESWYLAGLSRQICDEINFPYLLRNEEVTKEKFMEEINRLSLNELIFRQKIFNNYQIQVAKERNRSFRYFIDKLDNLDY